MTLRSSPVLTVLAAAVLFVAGCGGATRSLNEDFPAASVWFEGAPGSIAVLPGDDVPLLSVFLPETRGVDPGTDSSDGASSSASAECVADSVTGCKDETLAIPRVNTVAAGDETEAREIGSGYDSPSLRQVNAQLKHSLADRRPQLLVSHEVAARIRARTAYDARLKAFRGYPEEFAPEGPLSGLVEIGLTDFGLVIDDPVDKGVQDPRVALRIGVRADVYSMRQRKFVRESTGGWRYVGPPRRVSELTADNGRLLNEEIERAAKSLARRIVN